MSSNILPSAPAYEQTETQTTLYPVLPTQPDNNFRMQKANEVLKYLSGCPRKSGPTSLGS